MKPVNSSLILCYLCSRMFETYWTVIYEYINRGIIKTLYRCLLVEGAGIDEAALSRVRELGINCGSCKKVDMLGNESFEIIASM